MVSAKMSRNNRIIVSNVYPCEIIFEIRGIMWNVMSYVDEDDLFRMRQLNHMFQSFYYRQTKIRNCGRALLLSKMGRQFPRVTELKINLDNIAGSTLKYISPKTFARLHSVTLLSTSQRVKWEDLKRLKHPGITDLKVDLSQPSDLSAITEARFPQLRRLSVNIRGFICVKPYRPMRLSPHSKLEEITMDHMFLNYSFFDTLTAKHFPNLQMLKICEGSCFLIELSDGELGELIQRQGFKLVLLPNSGTIGCSSSLDRDIKKSLTDNYI